MYKNLHNNGVPFSRASKIYLIMRLTTIIILGVIMQVSATTYAQRVTLNERNSFIGNVLDKIRYQSGYGVLTDEKTLTRALPINVNFKDVSLDEALAICFKDQPMTYEIVDKTIIVKIKAPSYLDKFLNRLSNIDVTGRVVDIDGNPISGATVLVKNTNNVTISSKDGYFELRNVNEKAIITISYVGYSQLESPVKPSLGNIILQVTNSKLEEVEVVSTGYQAIPKERATGSFTVIDNKLLNRSVSTNILDRLNGVTSGLLFDNTTGTSTGFSIRGRSTIFANTDPLIVLDNFPYDGNLSNINPNDIENVTILKDAAAASIWGVRASNGVVVITSKKGSLNQPQIVEFNSNITIGQKPRLYGTPELSPSQIIDVESDLFTKGAYSNQISNPYTFISPVVQILLNKQTGLITANDAETQINALRNQNVKDDLLKYYYRNSINQQYSVNVNGGGKANKYYLSAGYDRNLPNLKSDSYGRFTINAHNTYNFLKDRLTANVGLVFTSERNISNAGNINDPSYIRPYNRLVDQNGNALNVLTYKKAWLDTVGTGRLLDWNWKPIDELNRKNYTNLVTNYLLNTSLTYKLFKGLDASVQYQYSKGITNADNLNTSDSYYTRNLINQYTQIDNASGLVTRPIPIGDIDGKSMTMYTSQNLRGQLNYNRSINYKHELSVIAGTEVKKYDYITDNSTLYGYYKNLGQISNVDYVNYYPNIVYGYSALIPGGSSEASTADRYLSYFANAIYTYNGKYSFSASARKDESNLFGVKSNQKGVPLWSIGGIWNISKERFYNLTWIPDLKLRITTGYNGNVDKTVSAFVTAGSDVGQAGKNAFGSQYTYLINPPNPSLRWEKIQITNLALDFSLLARRITGSIEYFYKSGKDLIGNSPLAPSTGVVLFRGNSANVSGNGYDLTINSENIHSKKFSWNTSFLFSKASDKITAYKVNTSPLGFHEGYPFNGIFSYRWAGLDHNTGDPLGYVDGKESRNWAQILNIDSIGKSTKYNGPGTPPYFGSLRNTFTYGNVSLSFNIIYKFGYYFRASSINYTNLFTSLLGHSDYNGRWQTSGDETKTNVPSLVYPADNSRDVFYNNSDALVLKGDNIRLKDVQISYNLTRRQFTKLPLANLQIFMFANNIGVIWKANNKGLDPDFNYPNLPSQKSLSVGLKTQF